MEGVSRISDYRECWPVYPQYWESGRGKMTADVVSAAQGLLAGGATEVVVRNAHGTGDWPNLLLDQLPAGVTRFDGDPATIDAAFQVGFHARCGTGDGFISHTMVPEFRIRVNGALITECHANAWHAGLPMLGITGDDTLGRELDGSLVDVPFLGVQHSTSRVKTAPVHADEAASLEAIHHFAAECARNRHTAPVPRPPDPLLVEISLRPDLADLVYTGSRMTRVSPSVLSLEGTNWVRDAKPAIGACVAAALRPWSAAHGALDLSSREQLELQPPENLQRMRDFIEHWMATNYPAWHE